MKSSWQPSMVIGGKKNSNTLSGLFLCSPSYVPSEKTVHMSPWKWRECLIFMSELSVLRLSCLAGHRLCVFCYTASCSGYAVTCVFSPAAVQELRSFSAGISSITSWRWASTGVLNSTHTSKSFASIPNTDLLWDSFAFLGDFLESLESWPMCEHSLLPSLDPCENQEFLPHWSEIWEKSVWWALSSSSFFANQIFPSRKACCHIWQVSMKLP